MTGLAERSSGQGRFDRAVLALTRLLLRLAIVASATQLRTARRAVINRALLRMTLAVLTLLAGALGLIVHAWRGEPDRAKVARRPGFTFLARPQQTMSDSSLS